MSDALPPICGAIKLVPTAFMPVTNAGGAKQVALTCVRKPGHPEPEDSSLHLCGTDAWPVGPGDDFRETDEYRREWRA